MKTSRLLTLVLSLTLLSACDSGAKPTPTFTGTVKIGVAAPYTGDTADGGIQIWQGAQLAVDQVNANGGILGNKIELVALDDAANATKGKTVANELVSQGVVAVVGHKDSGVSIPASEIYHQNNIVQISPTSSNPQLTNQGFDTVFRVCPRDTTQGPYLAEFMVKKLKLARIAVINANTTYGQGLGKEFQDSATALGTAPVIVKEIARGGKDFATTLEEIKGLSPDGIFYAGSLPEGIIIASQMKEIGMKATFVGGDTLFQPEFITQTGSAGEGAYVSSFFPNITQSANGRDRDWVASYRAEFKRNPGGNSSGGYVAAMSIIEAMRAANSIEPTMIKAALKNLNTDSLIGRIAFDQKGDLQDQTAHLHLFQVKDGQFVPTN
jgi:branched-chain amino acid transport system substrate-binding protein